MKADKAYASHLADFVLELAVECPHCRQEALVQTDHYPPLANSGKEPRLSCTHCGYSQRFSEKYPDKKNITYILGEAVDPYFHVSLWLQLRCGEEWLWAYNREHLRLLENHISAGLRERNGLQPRNNSIGSCLPRWMTAAKNRNMVLQAIRRLQAGERDSAA